MTTAIWIWAVVNLWNLNPQALTFVVILAAWNLILAVLEIFGASTFGAVLPGIILNGIILIYGMSPGGGFGSCDGPPTGERVKGPGGAAPSAPVAYGPACRRVRWKSDAPENEFLTAVSNLSVLLFVVTSMLAWA